MSQKSACSFVCVRNGKSLSVDMNVDFIIGGQFLHIRMEKTWWNGDRKKDIWPVSLKYDDWI